MTGVTSVLITWGGTNQEVLVKKRIWHCSLIRSCAGIGYNSLFRLHLAGFSISKVRKDLYWAMNIGLVYLRFFFVKDCCNKKKYTNPKYFRAANANIEAES